MYGMFTREDLETYKYIVPSYAATRPPPLTHPTGYTSKRMSVVTHPLSIQILLLHYIPGYKSRLWQRGGAV